MDGLRLGSHERLRTHGRRYLAHEGIAQAAASLMGQASMSEQSDEIREESEALGLDLGAYIEAAWHVVEPKREFVPGWHIDAIVEHLEAITAGEIRNLLINVPPRHSKSLNASVFWPTWIWTTRPEFQWLFTAYAQSLSTRDSLKCRRLIQGSWYQARWGHVFRLTGDQNLKTRFDNDRTGYRLATSVEGSATGEGGDAIVCDDPHNIKEAESDLKRGAVLTWWDEVMSTRLNDPKTGAKVIIMQRSHENDLAGHILEQGGYEHLCIPTEYELPGCVTGIGWEDPRHEEGELLWPERFTGSVIEDLKGPGGLGPYAYAAQHQQQPTARKGGLFERGWFEVVDASPRQGVRGRYWDKAGTEGGGKYTAGIRACLHGGVFYIEDVSRGQWSATVREPVIKQVADADAVKFGRGAVLIWLEQEPGSAGKESTDASIKNLVGHAAYGDHPTGDKFTRARPLAAAAHAGNVKVVRGDWNEDFLAEINKAGPGARFLDQMDSAAGCFNRLSEQPAPPEGIASGFADMIEDLEKPNPYRIS